VREAAPLTNTVASLHQSGLVPLDRMAH